MFSIFFLNLINKTTTIIYAGLCIERYFKMFYKLKKPLFCLLILLIIQTPLKADPVSDYQKAVKDNPNSASAHFNLASIYYQNGKLKESEEEYKKVIQINPNDHSAYFNLGIVYYDLRQYQEAIGAYQEALRINPVDGDSHFNIAIAYQSLGRLEESIQEYKAACKLKVQASCDWLKENKY